MIQVVTQGGNHQGQDLQLIQITLTGGQRDGGMEGWRDGGMETERKGRRENMSHLWLSMTGESHSISPQLCLPSILSLQLSLSLSLSLKHTGVCHQPQLH